MEVLSCLIKGLFPAMHPGVTEIHKDFLDALRPLRGGKFVVGKNGLDIGEVDCLPDRSVFPGGNFFQKGERLSQTVLPELQGRDQGEDSRSILWSQGRNAPDIREGGLLLTY